MQIIGEILEFKGKVVPEFMKIRKYFHRKKTEKDEMASTLKEVQTLLNDVNSHYSSDNISKRNDWMNWVNARAEIYDESINQLTTAFTEVAQTLRDNTKMTEEMFIQNSRDRIIDFATKVGDDRAVVSREEFNRIFKVYEKYEEFLAERGMKNGEVSINYQIIEEAYELRIKNHSFSEDMRGYNAR